MEPFDVGLHVLVSIELEGTFRARVSDNLVYKFPVMFLNTEHVFELKYGNGYQNSSGSMIVWELW